MPRINIRNFKPSNNSIINLESKNANSVEKLGTTSISVQTSDKKFSFKQKGEGSETLNNPNITDKPNFKELKNTDLSINKNFDNESDPIYDLDEGRSTIGMNKKEDQNRTFAISRFINLEIQRGIKNSSIRKSRATNKNDYWLHHTWF